MGYVDLRRRHQERNLREPADSRRYSMSNPYLLLAVGFVLGILSSSIFHTAMTSQDLFVVLLLLIAAVTLLGYVGWLLLRRSRESTRPKLGGEKQLLMAMLDAGGSISPVEAALQTSLTVEEAEEILTRFADRGHLLVESRDGALFYALPGRRPSPEMWTH